MSVNDIASWSTVVFETRYWKTISGVHVSLGSAETLVRRGRIRQKHVIVHSLSNISAKNYQNRLMRVEVIKCNISVVFFRHSVMYNNNNNNTIDVTNTARTTAATEIKLQHVAKWHDIISVSKENNDWWTR